MHTKLSIPERLKDLRVVDKHLTLEQLAEQTGLSKSALSKYESEGFPNLLSANMRVTIIRTSAPLPSLHWRNFTGYPPIT